MNPAIAQAKALYSQHGLDLNRELSDYLDFGYVFSTPDRLLLARPIDPVNWREWKPKNPTCWYVQLAVGKNCLKWFCDRMPYQLPFLAWMRVFKNEDHRLRVFPTDRFLAKL